MAIESITKTLGSGSGIDTGALVTSLIQAQFAAKTAALAAKSTALTAQISGVSKLRSAITGFDAALSSLISGGTLASTLTSSNPTAVKATAASGVDLASMSTTVQVMQLASAQVSSTNAPIARDAGWQGGTLSLQLGRDTVDANGAVTGFAGAGSPVSIAIDQGDTIDAIAAKINAAATGMTASVVTDGDGARLVLRGGSGGAQAFELTGTDDADATGASLADLTVGRGATATTSGTRARDAIVQVDGVRYTRASNTIEGVVAGVKLELLGLTGTPATLSVTRPTGALTAAVGDVVATYNEVLAQVKEQSDPATGALRADPAVSVMARDLRTLTTAILNPAAPAGAPRTLADVGVATGRDGTLSVDAKRLTSAMAKYPEAVEKMFAAGGGLSAALSKIAARATDKTYGLDAATARYTGEIGKIGLAQEQLAQATETTKTRMTRQFASMDARVAAYKSTQTFLKGQIDAWNASDN